MGSQRKQYAVYKVGGGADRTREATYSTVAEVLAHVGTNAKSFAVETDGETLSADDFMTRYVAAG